MSKEIDKKALLIRKRKLMNRIKYMIDYWEKNSKDEVQKDQILDLFSYGEIVMEFNFFNNWHDKIKEEE